MGADTLWYGTLFVQRTAVEHKLPLKAIFSRWEWKATNNGGKKFSHEGTESWESDEWSTENNHTAAKVVILDNKNVEVYVRAAKTAEAQAKSKIIIYWSNGETSEISVSGSDSSYRTKSETFTAPDVIISYYWG